MLITTASFTVQKRYCHDDLIGVTVFSHMDECNEKTVGVTSSHSERVKCCKDEIDFFKGQDTIKNPSDNDYQYVQKLVVTAFVYVYENLFTSLPQQITLFRDYAPPDIILDRQALHQVFLI
ncbi:hypothetical protein JF259_02760 [Snuella sp. CAU 1569]|uniref:Uncharacterized protein n=1 Tax=Snuella sedimenti TaxID=2798802 RepID=A0A8J7LXM6_9FLAO|nr:hypothetical protein [Snuella sedimenti]MBJ6367001.1 hypothetical protein [Snuella sedimenti]